MKCKHHDVEFDLPDQWIEEAGMINYKSQFECPPADESKMNGNIVKAIEIDSIEPLTERAKGRVLFQ